MITVSALKQDLSELEFRGENGYILVHGKGDLTEHAFTGLGILRYLPTHSPTPLNPTQILGLVLSSTIGRHNVCGQFPLPLLDVLCNKVLTMESLKVINYHCVPKIELKRVNVLILMN